MRLDRTHNSPDKSFTKNQQDADATARVVEVVSAAVDRFREPCQRQSIAIELDIAGCDAVAISDFVEQSADALIRNAIASMPRGGELSVTLVETPFQWELEVADSGANPSNVGKRNAERVSHEALTSSKELFQASEESSESNDALPKILQFPASEYIRDVIRMAQTQHGNLESWTCPLGGTAWVLVVPKKQTSTGSQSHAA